ncbi:MAG: DUF5691 domain-containing protein [Phycisphaerae bacterium]|nr:DUF5691 domain-containing protein [Phycisphaerae bacterium]
MDHVIKSLLIGTARQPVSGDAPADTPVDALVQRCAPQSAEQNLLLCAAAWTAYSLAGKESETVAAATDPAPAESRPCCSPAAADVLREILRGDYPMLRGEALRRLDAGGRRLPPELLPAALALDRNELRELARPVLGHRGVWLARLNPAWRWAADAASDAADAPTPDDAQRWNEGTFDERLRALVRARQVEPARARQWLADAWPRERAEDRAAFLTALRTSLSPDDEPFLEQALTDRAASVRDVAAEILPLLPASGFVRRMIARAEPLLRVGGAASGKLVSLARRIPGVRRMPTLHVDPPEDVDEAWARDAGIGKPPAGVGRRAWVLACTLRRTPLSHWTTRFEAAPAELIDAATASDWSAPLIEGWSLAALAQRPPDWLPPLWDFWRRQGDAGSEPARVRELRSQLLPAALSHMPRGEAEARVIRLMSEPLGVRLTVHAALSALPQPWSAAVARAWLKHAHAAARADAAGQELTDHTWPESLLIAAAAIPAECLDEAAAAWDPAAASDWRQQHLRRQIERFLDIIALRRRLIREIPLGA